MFSAKENDEERCFITFLSSFPFKGCVYTASLNAQIRSSDHIRFFLARLFTFILDTTGIRYLCLH